MLIIYVLQYLYISKFIDISIYIHKICKYRDLFKELHYPIIKEWHGYDAETQVQ
jgi:hypothetical protein